MEGALKFYLVFGLLLCHMLPTNGNLIANGDFETGDLSPWLCKQSHCEASEKHLAVTERTAEWSGPLQILDIEGLQTNEDLKMAFTFSMKSPAAIEAKWKVKVTKAEETEVFVIFAGNVDNQDLETYLTLPNFILGSDEVQLYLEVTPAESDYILDNISLESVDEGNWEEDANQRIDVLRKRSVSIRYNLVSTMNEDDLFLEIGQRTHKFPFGTAVRSDRIASCYDANEEDKYCEYVRDNFNWLVDTYRMKWIPSEPTEGNTETEIPDKMIEWAHSYEKTVRGHALIWAKRSNNPDWVQTLYGEELKTAVFNRLDFAIKHYEEYNVPHWDVINEMVDQGQFNHTFFLDHTGDPEIRVKIFKYVKELSPDTLFFLNDYGIILNEYGRFSLFQEQIRELLAAGAPIDAIGLQSHIHGEDLFDINSIKNHVDQLWEEFKLPIWVTEFDWNAQNDVAMGDHSFHAEQVEKFYRLMFSHEAVNGILMWALNILDDTTDLPNKAGETYQRLYQEEWRSSQLLKVNTDGNTFRGFMGDYSMRLLYGSSVLGEIEFNLEEDLEIACYGNETSVIWS